MDDFREDDINEEDLLAADGMGDGDEVDDGDDFGEDLDDSEEDPLSMGFHEEEEPETDF